MTITKKIILVVISSIIIVSPAAAFTLYGNSFFNPRSQSTNAALELTGWHRYINLYNQKGLYGAVYAAPTYGQSLRPDRTAQAMFSTDTLDISGSLVPDRGDNDILADYFGLSPAFESTVVLLPLVRTAMVDFDFYLGWGNFYFRVHAPVVWTQWQLRVCEEIITDGTNVPYPADYMAATAITAPATSFAQAVQGGLTWGQVTQGLNAGKFGCIQTAAGVSDVQFALGWNMINHETAHAGFNLRCSAPTGNRPTSEFLFEPIVGNGKHWEFGVGFTGHSLLWECDGQQELSLFGDMNVTHLFNACQRRSFDFIVNGFGSRYILAKQFDSTGDYTGNSLPAINVTTLNCKVRNQIEIDLALMFGYTYNNFVFDFGYNLWFRSSDLITLTQCIPLNTYGLKGIQDVTDEFGNLIVDTQTDHATLHGNEFTDQALVADPNPPVFFNTQDLDLTSAAYPRVLTNKLFAYVGGQWKDHWCGITPYLGVGADIEFEGINPRDQILPSKTTLSQWSVWIKGGLAY